jgi:hypothetical protein
LANRAIAGAIDILISSIPMVLILPVALLAPGSGQIDLQFLIGLVFFTSVPAMILFYYAMRLLAASRERATPGQRAQGLSFAYRDPGQKTRATLIRNVLLGPLPLLALFIIGIWPLMLVPLILPLLTRDSGYPIDRLSGVAVVSAP